jgi:hypothetical protein
LPVKTEFFEARISSEFEKKSSNKLYRIREKESPLPSGIG